MIASSASLMCLTAFLPLSNSPTYRFELADGIEHDYRDLALGLLLVIGVGRPELERFFPQPRPLRAGRGAGPRLDLRGPDLHLDFGVGEEVAVPAGMLRRAAFRGDHDIAAIAGLAVEQREDELLARFAAGGCQQQRRDRHFRPARLGHLVQVPFRAAAGEIAVGVLYHPTRQVRRE